MRGFVGFEDRDYDGGFPDLGNLGGLKGYIEKSGDGIDGHWSQMSKVYICQTIWTQCPR